MEAGITSYLQGIDNIKTIEGYGILADGRCEIMTEQTHLVIIDVNIGESVTHHHIEHLACLDKTVHARSLLADDNILLRMRRFTVDFPCDGLIDADGKYQFVVIAAGLHLIDEPRILLSEPTG